MSYVTLSIDDELKDASEKLFNELGFSFSSVINAFLRQAVREQEVSFRLKLKEPELSGWALTEKILEDSENNTGIHGPFSSFEELMRDIHAES